MSQALLVPLRSPRPDSEKISRFLQWGMRTIWKREEEEEEDSVGRQDHSESKGTETLRTRKT